jgi:membrane dipeptidase
VVRISPFPPSALTDVVDHIDRIRDVAGIDAVGVGSDFDGVEAFRKGSRTSRATPRCSRAARRGYSDEDLGKVAGHNVLRVLREAERAGERLRSERPASTATIEQLDG